MSYKFIYIHKNINCTINMRGKKTRKKTEVANNIQTYT